MPRHPSHILELAKRGAEHRYQEIKAEIAALEKMFSHLRYGSALSPAMPDAMEEATVRRRRRRKMTERAKKAISERMKKLWTARRIAKKA
jgi:hypothetical protein